MSMHISYSRVASYLSCPYKHYLGYVLRLKQKKPVRPLYFGTDFHKLLELRNNQEELAKARESIKDAFYEMKPSWQSELGENYVEDLFTIFSDYQDVYKDCPQPKVTEKQFIIPVGRAYGQEVVFKGVIDELYKLKHNGEKLIKIGEHKTFSRKPDSMMLVMNTQKCLYAKAAQILYGILPKSVIWDYIYSSPAPEPMWLEKSKRFSNTKSDKITPYSWLRGCERHGVTDPEVLGQAEQFRGNIPNYFFRCELEFVPGMVDQIYDGFIYMCKEIALRGEKNKTKNLTWNCPKCAYNAICHAELTGGDVQYIIDKDFEYCPQKDESEQEEV